jgi:hypothetical protein
MSPSVRQRVVAVNADLRRKDRVLPTIDRSESRDKNPDHYTDESPPRVDGETASLPRCRLVGVTHPRGNDAMGV